MNGIFCVSNYFLLFSLLREYLHCSTMNLSMQMETERSENLLFKICGCKCSRFNGAITDECAAFKAFSIETVIVATLPCVYLCIIWYPLFSCSSYYIPVNSHMGFKLLFTHLCLGYVYENRNTNNTRLSHINRTLSFQLRSTRSVLYSSCWNTRSTKREREREM